MLVERLTRHGALTPSTSGTGACLEIELPALPTAPAQARRIARQACLDWQIPHIIDDVCLVVSELVTNAVQHAQTPLVLAMEHEGSTLAVAVGDGQTRTPRFADQAPEGAGGRGILLVSTLGTDWGVVRTVLGKTVWVSLKVRP